MRDHLVGGLGRLSLPLGIPEQVSDVEALGDVHAVAQPLTADLGEPGEEPRSRVPALLVEVRVDQPASQREGDLLPASKLTGRPPREPLFLRFLIWSDGSGITAVIPRERRCPR